MTEPYVEFSEQQQAVLNRLVKKWKGIAEEAEQLANDCPARDVKLALQRKAVHYRSCAAGLRMLAI